MKRIPTIPLAGAAVVVPKDPQPIVTLAAHELARYLQILTDAASPVVDQVPSQGPAVILREDPAAKTGDQGYRLCAGRNGLEIVAGTPRATLHGVYALLEELGVGFHLGGETFPQSPTDARVPVTLDRVDTPAFPVRGHLLHDNALIGVSSWGLDDYRVCLERLARLRCNTLFLAHYGLAAAELFDEQLDDPRNLQPLMSTLTKPWGATRALRTDEFFYGTGAFFDEELFASPTVQKIEDPVEQRREAQHVFREALRHAQRFGIDVACGFSEPCGDVNRPADPTDPQTVERFRQRVGNYVTRYPELRYFVLLNHESGGCSGTAPLAGPAAGTLLDRHRDRFAYLKNPRRIWEAIRFGRFAQLAHETLREAAPHMSLVICGWGGDQWMRFADFCLGYDDFLPPEVIFTCFDNIDVTFSDQVSAAWGQLPATRRRWAVPWIESDDVDFWSPHAALPALERLCPDALQKGCRGLLTMSWRTGANEQEIGYGSRFAWKPNLTARAFLDRFARDMVGEAHGERVGAHLLALQNLGRRWTGVMGTPEIGEMVFAAARPHLPFELDESIAEFLLPFARDARAKLSRPPDEQGRYAGIMFSLDLDETNVQVIDASQLGVGELSGMIEQIESLRGQRDADVIRQALLDLDRDIFALRTKLIERGMPPPQFYAFDRLMNPVHHLAFRGGTARRMQTLAEIRADLIRIRQLLEGETRSSRSGSRSERLDRLIAEIDFVTHFDQCAMLLAPGELVERAIASGDPVQAAAARRALLDAGMDRAVDALTRRLNDRDDFAVLATVNIKPLGAYFDSLAKLENLITD